MENVKPTTDNGTSNGGVARFSIVGCQFYIAEKACRGVMRKADVR
jgi:hypothetical protein